MGYAGDHASLAAEAATDHVDTLLQYARAELHDGPSYKYCEDCGEEIPAARREAISCTRCIKCQEAHDKLPKTRVRMLDHVL